MLEIKRADARNIDELRDIGIRSYLPHYSHLWKPGGVDWYMDRCFGDDALRKDFSDPNIEYYIIADESQNVGILKLVLQKPLIDSAIVNALYLEKIYFIKEWTGKGAGGKLMRFTIERARELKRECVWLMAMDTAEKPISAYERAGFAVHSRTRLDFSFMKEEFRGMVAMKHCFETNGN
ncbi:MAG TPA: GNAT family N-acetyltransferase [Pyrinomonadaceae bacterium]|jgi:GNAT superfamily N-acetyltransferase